jgi:hypothetical protein
MEHRTTAEFWQRHQDLPSDVRDRADKQFALLKSNPQHPSLSFKKIGNRNGTELWSARVTLNYRAVAIRRPDGYVWFWIGTHKAYDVMIG